jgi:hypothetical protein
MGGTKRALNNLPKCARCRAPKEIADYCEIDVIGTYQVCLRYELFRGTLSQNAFVATERRLADFITARSSIKNSL